MSYRQQQEVNKIKRELGDIVDRLSVLENEMAVAPCACRQVELTADEAVEIASRKHTGGLCGPCCTHGTFVDKKCSECSTPSYKTALDLVDNKKSLERLSAKQSLQIVVRMLSILMSVDAPSGAPQWARIVAVADSMADGMIYPPLDPHALDYGKDLSVWQIMSSFSGESCGKAPSPGDWANLADNAFIKLVRLVGDK